MKDIFTVRPAKSHDAKKIFGFLCKLEEELFDQEEFRLNYQICLSGANHIYLVAVGEDNDPVGFISCHGQILLHHGGMVYEIQEFFVDTDYRNIGIGRLLLEELEKNLDARKCESLEVTTRKWRTEARKFYTDHGFEQTHMKFTKQMG